MKVPVVGCFQPPYRGPLTSAHSTELDHGQSLANPPQPWDHLFPPPPAPMETGRLRCAALGHLRSERCRASSEAGGGLGRPSG